MNQAALATANHALQWESYRSNLPRHLIGLARYLQSSLMQRLIEQCGHEGLTLQFEPYITLAGIEGIGLAKLAGELNISKQAVNQTVNQIEQLGYLERAQDPADGRAKLAVLTDKGRQLLQDGAQHVAAVEVELADHVGIRELAAFTRGLGELYDGMQFPRPTFTRGESFLGWLLPRMSDQLMQQLMAMTREQGHPGLKMSYGQVLTLMPPGGGRIQQMARINEVSKQAISAIARELEDKGYLCRETDPEDARQVSLHFTARGEQLIIDSVTAVEILESRFEQVIGRRRLDNIKRTAQALYEGLQLETEIFAPASGAQSLDQLAKELVEQMGAEEARALAMRLSELTESAESAESAERAS